MPLSDCELIFKKFILIRDQFEFVINVEIMSGEICFIFIFIFIIQQIT